MKHAEPPHVYHGKLILSYDADHYVRFVGVAFEHENYKDIHVFQRNEYDVFFLVIPLSGERKRFVYRLIVDGLWMPDPLNPATRRDERGVRVSVFNIPELPKEPITGPRIRENGKVTFYYKGPENRVVYLTGSFNNWEPFMYRLQETEPGFYSITVKLREGEHFYYFISNGKMMLDPYNSRRGTNNEGFLVSYLRINGDVAETEEDGGLFGG